MGKKGSNSSPLSNMQGADEGATIIRQIKMLSEKARKTGVDIDKVFAESFGMEPSQAKHKLIANDGTEFTFFEIAMTPTELEENTYAVVSVNGREQLFTVEQCSDIKSVENQQYYNAFGVIDSNGKINVLDGSRRRFYYLYSKPDYKFRIWVTDQDLTEQQAKWFAADMQSAKPKSYRDEGLRLKELQQENPEATYAELGVMFAEMIGSDVIWDKKGVQRRLDAANLPVELIKHFSLGLSARNFGELSALFKGAYGESLEKMTDTLKKLPKRDISESDTEYNNRLIKELKDAGTVKANKTKSTHEIAPGFNNRKRKATKTIKKNGIVAFEFKGLRESDIESVEEFIKSTLQSIEE